MESVNMEQLKTEIIDELNRAGASVIDSEYDGFKELASILNKFDKHVERYNAEVDRVTQRYADKVKFEKIHALDVDLAGEKSWVAAQLSNIVEKDNLAKKEAIAKNLKSQSYKESRNEAIEILSRFGANLDTETTMELIKPLIEAKDRTILKALQCTSNKDTRFLYTSAINKIEEYLSTNHLELCIRDARRYIANPKQKKSLILESAIYKYKK
ncbi:MAG: hypothetical protein J6D47_11625 [Peptostreptococcaceae bacterium]|nr:hypothetical protein [Peptostreptococcaceae bacterium]